MASRKLENPSIVEYFAEHEKYRCGYCGSKDTNYSHGLWAHMMSIQDYQDLIDRGWRRSGQYCYKPTMNVTCCPHYTIRCDVDNFKLSKSQRKVIKLVNRYLIKGERRTDGATGGVADENIVCKTKREEQVMDTKDKHQRKLPKPGVGLDPNRPACRKAKDIRREMKLLKQQKLQDNGTSSTTLKNSTTACEAKSLEELLSEPDQLPVEQLAHRLEVKLIRSSPRSAEFERTFQQTHNIYHKYQMVVHKDPPEKPNVRQYTRFLVNSPLEIRLVRSHPISEEYRRTSDQSYSVFKKYQMAIHKDGEDDCTMSMFNGFLVDSPLQPSFNGPSPDCGYGSFHQHYILDGKIIAVGVIDVLPSCASSVYLYYDPEYEFLSLGTYSALRELAFTRSLHKQVPALEFYYMGFYIHSCPKMTYKGQYYPSYLLCPETYRWVPIEQCRPKLDKSNYSRLEDDQTKVDPDLQLDLSQLLVLVNRSAMLYPLYRQLTPSGSDEPQIKEYAELVGKKCYSRMLLFRKGVAGLGDDDDDDDSDE